MEEKSLNLVVDVHMELGAALNSLGNKTPRDMSDNYKFWSSFYMGRASQGYIVLRKKSAFAESRFLVRPVIEIMFRLEAVRHQPELVYRIGYTETRLEDRKWLIALAKSAGKQFDEVAFDERWMDFKKEIQSQFPNAQLEDKRLTVKQAAEAGKLGGVYDTIYATYCRYTHGALRAIVGELDEPVGAEDNYLVASCLMCAIDALVSIGADAPNFDSLKMRQKALEQEKIDRDDRANGR